MTAPRAAATVIVLSECVAATSNAGVQAESGTLFKILMIKRHSKARFMANTYVFPGGCVDAGDVDVAKREMKKLDLDPSKVSLPEYRVAALRELQEETALSVSASGVGTAVGDNFSQPSFQALANLVPYSHWVTPKQEGKYRYDTRFFFCSVQPEADDVLGKGIKGDPKEVADVRWVTPVEALALHKNPEEKNFTLPPPTAMLMNYLSSYDSAKEILETYRGRYDGVTGTDEAKKTFEKEKEDKQEVEPSATPSTNLRGVELMPRIEPVLDLVGRPLTTYMKQHWTHIPVGTFPMGPNRAVTVVPTGQSLPTIPPPASKL